ncbi:MAG: gliding motility-associated C-terminal domain-containing protein [Dysgonamonadaceae bacterium]|jgi:gliding motility-associated-like protein|nr:gliding motility-associated C-terminal domain-containing protein [Dysgonamonadaceae bacterium]
MKRTILQILFLLQVLPAFSQYAVTGGNGMPYLVDKKENSVIDVYLLNGLSNAKISFTSAENVMHQWYRYNRSANDVTAIQCTQNGKESFITDNIADGYGYFVGTPTDPATRFVWIIDYSKYIPVIYSLKFDDESDDRCEYLKIMAEVEAPPLQYYLPHNGNVASLQRTFHLQYTTMEWIEDSEMFVDKPVDMPLKGEPNEIVVESPLKNTDFVLSGDDFSAHFGIKKSFSTPVYEAIAVKAIGIVKQSKTYGDNEQKTSSDVLGGSAPVDITFTAYANEPVAALFIWNLSKINPATGNMEIISRYTGKVFQYNFVESGDYKAMLEVVDSKSVCKDTTQVFPVMIGETDIQIPNFFSPGSTAGVNDEFRVSYKSISNFKCSIFNRWGNLLYQWNDPAKGWNGTVAGKFVPTGVYFYIIEYTDSNGKKQVKKGSINILRSKK